MSQHPSHKPTLDALKRIEGQIRGIQRMVEQKRYCVDILTQLSAVVSAAGSVQDKILTKHLNSCVTHTFADGSKREKKKKVDEIIKLLKRFRRAG